VINPATGAVFASAARADQGILNSAVRIVEHRRPLGVVAAIAPLNSPLQLRLIKLGPELFAGNTVGAKPSATTPLSTCLLGEIWNEILPPGVFNLICDDNDLGDALTSHPGIDKIASPAGRPPA
jgi:acyl-CoA reductase-like NAD-dependent aldehyde dehydrogenase